MKPIRYLGVALLFVLGCEGTPTVTRSGDVKDIAIGEKLSSAEVAVSPGDEVRWINNRTSPVRIEFLDEEAHKQLSCKNNFGGMMTPSNTAKLARSESASVCFRDPGYFRYTVRMESTTSTGEINVPGVIKVGGQGSQAVGQTSDQNNGKTIDRTDGLPSSLSTTPTTMTTLPPATSRKGGIENK